MKKALLILFIISGIALVTSCIYYVPYPEGDYPPPEEQYYEEEYPGYGAQMDTSYFYDYLSPHGIWVYHRPHGYVWIPQSIGYGWRPYSNGRWVWTSYGWTWVSFYDWGWAPFHYGRWGWDVSLGWFWVPGTMWGPAWVTWRHGSSYIGWAPLPPDAGFVIGVGVRRLPYPIPDTFWIFVDGRYFLDSHVYRYMLPIERNYTIIRKTMIETNIVHRNRLVVNEGIDVDTVSRMTNQRISKYMLEDSDKPGPSNVRAEEIRVYKPQFRKNERAVPKSTVTESEAKDIVTRSRIRKETGEEPGNEESWLKERQDREAEILKESQDREVMRIREDKTSEINETRSEQERKKAEKDYEAKIESTKKRHEVEKSLMKQRHEKEVKKVKETKEEKKTDKKEKKGKERTTKTRTSNSPAQKTTR
ncbi:MAG: hypothetical protein JXB23_08125 [Candidatus Aminicenantes bacterium]|nr:hypothetical protein [Candidatus Aminicenantes bacterium]